MTSIFFFLPYMRSHSRIFSLICKIVLVIASDYDLNIRVNDKIPPCGRVIISLLLPF